MGETNYDKFKRIYGSKAERRQPGILDRLNFGGSVYDLKPGEEPDETVFKPWVGTAWTDHVRQGVAETFVHRLQRGVSRYLYNMYQNWRQ